MYAPGKVWLKITGILSVIIGFGGIVYGIWWCLNVYNIFTSSTEKSTAIFLLPYAIFFTLQGIVTLAAGVTGVKNAEDTEKYKKCLVLGMIVAGANLVPLFTGGRVLDIAVSLLVPVCYLIGVFLNKKGLEDVDKLG